MLTLDNKPTLSTAKTSILLTESSGFSAAALRVLESLGSVLLENLDRPGLMMKARSADVLWVRLRHQINQEFLDAAPQLKLIVTPTTGLNHIDLDAAAARNIPVISLRGETEFLKDVRATAELTIGLMLSLLRRIPSAAMHTLQGGWDRDQFCGGELCGRTIGLVGFGRLGRIVARYLNAFDSRVLVNDPSIVDSQLPDYVENVSFDRLLRESDIVSLHVNLSSESFQFFGASAFQRMKPDSLFINTSRGELVDEGALLSALSNGRLAAAALDVLSQECSTGMQTHPLIEYAATHENLVVTPHIGGCTFESMAKTELFLAQRLAEIWPSLLS